MNCQEVQDLLHGYVDGELEVVKSLEIERHLQACQACGQAYGRQRALRSALQNSALYYPPPVALEKRVRAAVRHAARGGARLPMWPWRWLGVAASLAVAAVMLWQLVPLASRSSADARLTQELIASHVRSLLASHLTDVASADQHTVKPWFEGKLDFSPPVSDLTRQGFPLVGGRLDYIDNRPVAALIYRHRQHVINLFIWPTATEAHVSAATLTRQGYHLIHWAEAGMAYWAVSNLNPSDLQAFARAVQTQTSLTTPPSP